MYSGRYSASVRSVGSQHRAIPFSLLGPINDPAGVVRTVLPDGKAGRLEAKGKVGFRKQNGPGASMAEQEDKKKAYKE